jgi:septal ring factor EnvC (AmiA/AmiB activator)
MSKAEMVVCYCRDGEDARLVAQMPLHEQTRWRIKALLARRADLEAGIAAARDEITELSEQIAQLERERVIEAAAADTENFASMQKELAETLAALDAQGWTPQREATVHRVMAAFRLARLSGHSAEALRLFIERCKSPTTSASRRLRWAALRDWIKSPAPQVAA